MILFDGIELRGHTNIVALGITTDRDELALGRTAASARRCTSRAVKASGIRRAIALYASADP
jgi:hypothetical protein